MNTTTNRRLLRCIPTALAAAAITLGATAVIDPALASAAPPVTTNPAPPSQPTAIPALPKGGGGLDMEKYQNCIDFGTVTPMECCVNAGGIWSPPGSGHPQGDCLAPAENTRQQ